MWNVDVDVHVGHVASGLRLPRRLRLRVRVRGALRGDELRVGALARDDLQLQRAVSSSLLSKRIADATSWLENTKSTKPGFVVPVSAGFALSVPS